MSVDISQAQLNLTPDEKRVYGQLFKQADPEGLGVVTGNVAVDFLRRTKLDPTVLGEIWQIADTENRGLLTPLGFSTVLRLIGHCQNGGSPSSELAVQPGPLPRFDGITIAMPSAAPLPAQLSGNAPLRVPPLIPEKVNEYTALFNRAGAQNGSLSGDIARQAFERAGLPNEILGQIWGLSDVNAKGALNVTEFIVAMHLINSMRLGAMRALPQVLPQGLWDAAARRPAGNSSPTIAKQLTGQMGTVRTSSPLARQQFSPPPIPVQTTGSDWLVTPADKAKFDQIFSTVDSSRRGFITGQQAVTFFSNSGLSEDVLASIWDLADIKSEGQLNKDEFSVAMYLIRQQKLKKDGRGDLPASLPPRLVPPSMRNAVAPPSQTTAPAFDNDAFSTPQPKGAAEDLFGLDALSAEEPAQPAAVAAPTSPASPDRSAQSVGKAPGANFKQRFVPTSSFGQGLAHQNTGGSTSSQQPANVSRTLPATSSISEDLLGDTDPEINSKITAETSELANMSSQVGVLRNQMQEVQAKKVASQQELANSSAQKKELEGRLAQFRASYEAEVREVKALDEALTASRAARKKLESELAMVEGAHIDLKNQHAQVAAALESDQRENASLKEKLKAVNLEVTALKPELEKMRSEARQQKGLVAINKKQVATSEAEREKLQAEAQELGKQKAEYEAAAAALAKQEASSTDTRRQVESSIPPATSNREVASSGSASPVSNRASMNPFFRTMSGQSSTNDQVMSPSIFTQEFGAGAGANSFDSFFATDPEPSQPLPPSAPSTTQSNTSPIAETLARPETPKVAIARDFAAPATPQMQTLEPPPPPTASQITSSSLPLRPAAMDAESYSSSVRAMPPASVADTSEVSTPTKAPAASELFKREITPSAAEPEPKELSDPPQESQSIPGAFPGEAESIAKSAIGDDKAAEQVTESNDLAKASQSATESTTVLPAEPQPVGPEPAVRPKDDFDSAFEGLSAAEEVPSSKGAFESAFEDKPVPNGSSGKQHEFPPIQDLEQDDDEDSDSDAGNGFEDSFMDQSLRAAKGKAVAPPEVSTPVASANIPSSASADVFSQAPSLGTTTKPEPSQKASTNDAFDSAFDDLDDAKEDEDLDEVTRSTHQSEVGFNPTFETPERPRASENGYLPPPGPPPGKAAAGNFMDFEGSPSNVTAKTVTTGPQSSAAPAPAADWDDIFSSLDKAPHVEGSSKSPFALDDPSGSASAALKTDRPTQGLGRAISAGTEHDDPILKSLTGMGFPRNDALKALEKYDYNLDKAADYLARKK